MRSCGRRAGKHRRRSEFSSPSTDPISLTLGLKEDHSRSDTPPVIRGAPTIPFELLGSLSRDLPRFRTVGTNHCVRGAQDFRSDTHSPLTSACRKFSLLQHPTAATVMLVGAVGPLLNSDPNVLIGAPAAGVSRS